MAKEKKTAETQTKRLRVMNKMRGNHFPPCTLLCIVFIAAFCLSVVSNPITSSATHGRAVTTTGISFTPKISTLYPALIATKLTDTTEVVVGENITVIVTIRNFGNRTAYNVSYVDRFSNPWIFNVTGITTLSYAQIRPNGTRVFGYSLTAKSLGSFDLQPAVIEYYDSEVIPTKFTAFTNSVKITVIEPREDFSLANFNAALILLISLIFIDLILLFRLIAPKLDRRGQQANSF